MTMSPDTSPQEPRNESPMTPRSSKPFSKLRRAGTAPAARRSGLPLVSSSSARAALLHRSHILGAQQRLNIPVELREVGPRLLEERSQLRNLLAQQALGVRSRIGCVHSAGRGGKAAGGVLLFGVERAIDVGPAQGI